MLLTKITLQDYGVYRGKNEFDFTCTADRPIILIGGTNGAGKTTLFESIVLCLYGITSMGRRCTKKSYEQFLSKKIHRYGGSNTLADFASITVQFRFFHAGKETEYRVSRTWRRTDTGIGEQLLVSKRHGDEQFLPLDIVEEAYWQSFIKDLIPRGVVNLFFFDGEKVVEMARAEKNDFAIKDSFKSLLGLDVVEQLRVDLQVNLVRNLTKGGSALHEEYEKYKTEKEEYQTTNEKLTQRIAQRQNDLDHLQLQIESNEAKISRIGGEIASDRESAKVRLASRRSEYTHFEKSIHDNCSSYLPFSLVPDRLDEIKTRIIEDQEILQEKLGSHAAELELARIRRTVNSNQFWSGIDLDEDVSRQIRNKLIKLTKNPPGSKGIKTETFGLSSVQAARIFRTIDESNCSALEKLLHDTKKLTAIGKEIQMLERTLTSAAGDDEVGRLVSELGRLNTQAGEIRSEMNHMEEKQSSNAAMCTHIDTKMTGIVTQMYQDKKSKEKVQLTQRIQAILDEFLTKIKEGKLRLLEQYLLENTQLLLQKKQFVEKIHIDPDTFAVTLYGKDDQHIPKDVLSEGEKQMFAIALLWALAKTSGKPLPFMIDTPLARLDEAHRLNITGKFLPRASHQVIIFSTDKEIEHEHYGILQPYITRSYVMRFSDKDGCTKRHDGYFWNNMGEKITAV